MVRRALANPELGAKQVCPNCQSKFYDLQRRPAVCPKCGFSFDPEEALRSRKIVRGRAGAPEYEAEEDAEEKPAAAAPDEEGFEDEADDTPEIDAAADAEPLETEEGDDVAPAPEPEPDLGVDFEEDADLAEEGEDVPFLEDEDEDFPDDDLADIPADDDTPDGGR